MTRLIVDVDGKTKRFQKPNLESTLHALRRSPFAARVVSALGLKWTRKLFWPIVKPDLLKDSDSVSTPEIALPEPFGSLITENTQGTAGIDLGFSIADMKDFSADIVGSYETHRIELDANTELSSPQRAAALLQKSFQYLTSYNITVDKIRFDIVTDNIKKASISADLEIPSDLYYQS